MLKINFKRDFGCGIRKEICPLRVNKNIKAQKEKLNEDQHEEHEGEYELYAPESWEEQLLPRRLHQIRRERDPRTPCCAAAWSGWQHVTSCTAAGRDGSPGNTP